MKICSILEEIRTTRGSIAKAEIIKNHADDVWLKKVLRYGLDQMMPFHIVKVPKVKDGERSLALPEVVSWSHFFHVADLCASRGITGNEAVDSMHEAFKGSTVEAEKWMRKILEKRLSLGVGAKSVNKIYPGLIPTFEVSLAQKFEEKRLKGKSEVAVEPKLDGIRCFAIVENNMALLYARSGKLISNFDSTIGAELATLPTGCYDGELMGEDFVALMRQAYRKDNVVTEGTYLSLFDYLPISEWRIREPSLPCKSRYKVLNNIVNNSDTGFKYLKCIARHVVAADYSVIKEYHDRFVSAGFEGAMIKDLDAPYKFGRGYEVMKLKAFHDVDLIIERLEEGTGRHENRLGAVVVSYKGTEVKVGSGFTDELRAQIWNDPASYTGRMIEVRYQEVTPDGSLRFPTFVCFRNDRQGCD